MALFQPGQVANPGGRPKGSSIKVLIDAIERFEKKNSVSYWDLVIAKSTKNPVIMNMVIRKCIPDMVDHEGRIDGNFNLTIDKD